MNYEESLNYIQGTAKFGTNLGLERVEKILEFLGNPHKKIKTIHAAGTNGKGSIVSMTARILQENGYKVGMYTSPHLEVFEERIQINGENISKEDLAYCVTEVSKAVDKVLDAGYDNPTEFEIETAAMFYYFYIKKVDFAVVEVGLGGRLDATNAMPGFDKKSGGGVMLSIIASISYDHMHILGDTLEKIAYEKAGIIKNGIPVVLYPQKPEAEKVIEDICRKRNSKLIKVEEDSVKIIGCKKIDKNSENFCQHIEVSVKNDIYDVELSLLGKHQLLNCATALFAIDELKSMGVDIKKEKTIYALSRVKWIGRLEVLNRKPIVVIDGAHNIDGIEKLKYNVQHYFKYRKLILVLGILADKEVHKMADCIVPISDRVICVTPNSDRAETAAELSKIVSEYNPNCEYFESYEEAYKKALSCASEDDIILISGSLYMIGDMRKIINMMGEKIMA